MIENVFPYTTTIVGTWRSTHVIFNLAKRTLVLVENDPQRKNKKPQKNHNFFWILFCFHSWRKKMTQDWLQTSQLSIIFFRFCITSLYKVVFGRFPRPKKCNFWPKVNFWHLFFKSYNYFWDFPSSWFVILISFHFLSFSWTPLSIRYPQ